MKDVTIEKQLTSEYLYKSEKCEYEFLGAVCIFLFTSKLIKACQRFIWFVLQIWRRHRFVQEKSVRDSCCQQRKI